MAILNKGQTFSDGGQITSTKLNTAVDGATFASGAVDDVSTQLSGGAIIVKDGGVGEQKLGDGSVTLQKLATAVKDALYPVGSIYTNATNSTNPATLIGFGTWVAFGAGRVLIGEGSDSDDQPTPETVSFTAGDEGGEYNHTLTTSEMPSHTHAYTHPNIGSSPNSGVGTSSSKNYPTANGGTTTSTGGGQAHNNLQPYIVVYMWKRTA